MFLHHCVEKGNNLRGFFETRSYSTHGRYGCSRQDLSKPFLAFLKSPKSCEKAQPFQHLKPSNSKNLKIEKTWKIPNHKRDTTKRLCIPQIPSCNMPSTSQLQHAVPATNRGRGARTVLTNEGELLAIWRVLDALLGLGEVLREHGVLHRRPHVGELVADRVVPHGELRALHLVQAVVQGHLLPDSGKQVKRQRLRPVDQTSRFWKTGKTSEVDTSGPDIQILQKQVRLSTSRPRCVAWSPYECRVMWQAGSTFCIWVRLVFAWQQKEWWQCDSEIARLLFATRAKNVTTTCTQVPDPECFKTSSRSQSQWSWFWSSHPEFPGLAVRSPKTAGRENESSMRQPNSFVPAQHLFPSPTSHPPPTGLIRVSEHARVKLLLDVLHAPEVRLRRCRHLRRVLRLELLRQVVQGLDGLFQTWHLQQKSNKVT